jgi:hypothetical protein
MFILLVISDLHTLPFVLVLFAFLQNLHVFHIFHIMLVAEIKLFYIFMLLLCISL